MESTAPNPQRSLLVIEVANSSLRRDLRVKAGIYADAEVQVYWVVDMVAREVVVHRDRHQGTYRDIRRVATPTALRGSGIDVPLDELVAFAFPPHMA